MVINSLNEIKNIHFTKIGKENNYIQGIYASFIEMVDLLEKNKEFLSQLQVEEIGKPIRYCRSEVDRCICLLKQAIIYTL